MSGETKQKGYLWSLWNDVSTGLASTALLPFKDAFASDVSSRGSDLSSHGSEFSSHSDSVSTSSWTSSKSASSESYSVDEASSDPTMDHIFSRVSAEVEKHLKGLLEPRSGVTPSAPHTLELQKCNLGVLSGCVLVQILQHLALCHVLQLYEDASALGDLCLSNLCLYAMYDRTYVRNCARRGFVDRPKVWPWLISFAGVGGFHDLFIRKVVQWRRIESGEIDGEDFVKTLKAIEKDVPRTFSDERAMSCFQLKEEDSSKTVPITTMPKDDSPEIDVFLNTEESDTETEMSSSRLPTPAPSSPVPAQGPGAGRRLLAAERKRLQTVLGVYALMDPAVGYVQGMNFVAAAVLLAITDELDAFAVFSLLMKLDESPPFDPSYSCVDVRSRLRTVGAQQCRGRRTKKCKSVSAPATDSYRKSQQRSRSSAKKKKKTASASTSAIERDLATDSSMQMQTTATASVIRSGIEERQKKSSRSSSIGSKSKPKRVAMKIKSISATAFAGLPLPKAGIFSGPWAQELEDRRQSGGVLLTVQRLSTSMRPFTRKLKRRLLPGVDETKELQKSRGSGLPSPLPLLISSTPTAESSFDEDDEDTKCTKVKERSGHLPRPRTPVSRRSDSRARRKRRAKLARKRASALSEHSSASVATENSLSTTSSYGSPFLEVRRSAPTSPRLAGGCRMATYSHCGGGRLSKSGQHGYGLRAMSLEALPGCVTALLQFEQLVKLHLPLVDARLSEAQVAVQSFASEWFMTCFSYVMPDIELMHRLFDLFLADGYKALHRFGLAILHRSRLSLLKADIDEVLVYLKTFPDSGVFVDYENDERCGDSFIADAMSFKVTNSMLHLSATDILAKSMCSR